MLLAIVLGADLPRHPVRPAGRADRGELRHRACATAARARLPAGLGDGGWSGAADRHRHPQRHRQHRRHLLVHHRLRRRHARRAGADAPAAGRPGRAVRPRVGGPRRAEDAISDAARSERTRPEVPGGDDGRMPIRPLTPDALTRRDRRRRSTRAGPGRVRVLVDGAAAARPEVLADALVDPLRVRSRPVVRVSAWDYLRPASVRLERGRTDPDAFYDDWLDAGALVREVLAPIGSRRERPGPARLLGRRQSTGPAARAGGARRRRASWSSTARCCSAAACRPSWRVHLASRPPRSTRRTPPTRPGPCPPTPATTDEVDPLARRRPRRPRRPPDRPALQT